MSKKEPDSFAATRTKQMRETRARRTGKWEWTGKCTATCKMNPAQLESKDAFVTKLFQEGETDRSMSKLLRDMDYSVSPTAIARHRTNHLYKADYHDRLPRNAEADQPSADPSSPQVEEKIETVDNIEALRKIISVGMRKASSGKITPELVVKAIELEERLTRGTKTSALLEALTASAGDEQDLDDDYQGESPADAAERLSTDPHA